MLTAELATALGHASAETTETDRPQVLIIRDTRDSGPMLEAALAAGVAQGGGDALLGGVLPTPAASVLVRRLGLDLAMVVSASHNPWRDNGIKFFGPDGGKLSDEIEKRIEAWSADRLGRAHDVSDSSAEAVPPESIGRVRTLEASLADYLRELSSTFSLDLSGRRGRARLRARGHLPGRARRSSSGSARPWRWSGAEPTGRNINDGRRLDAPAGARRAGRRRRRRDRLRLRRRRRPGRSRSTGLGRSATATS